jgi:hypothetical protein
MIKFSLEILTFLTLWPYSDFFLVGGMATELTEDVFQVMKNVNLCRMSLRFQSISKVNRLILNGMPIKMNKEICEENHLWPFLVEIASAFNG